MLGFVFNSRATFLEIINYGLKHNTYSRCFEPLSRPVAGIEQLPACSKLPLVPPYFALDIFLSFNSRVLFATFPDVIDQIVNLAEARSPRIPTLYSSISTMELPKKGCRLHHHDLKRRNEDINVMDRPLREEQPRPRRSVRISQPHISYTTS